jgi:hypothetical protein
LHHFLSPERIVVAAMSKPVPRTVATTSQLDQ